MQIIQATPKVQILNTFEFDLAFDDPVAPDHHIIVLAGVWSAQGGGFAASTPVTDSLGHEYELCVQSGLGAVTDTEGNRAGIFYTPDPTVGGENTINIQTLQGNEYGQAIALEVEGLENSSLDRTVSNQFTRALSSSPCSTGNTALITQADELVVAVMSLYEFDTNINLGAAAATGYTGLYQENDAENNVGGAADYKIVSAAEVQSATWTHDPITNATKGWACALATFRSVATAPPGGPLTTPMITSYINLTSRSYLRR